MCKILFFHSSELLKLLLDGYVRRSGVFRPNSVTAPACM